MNRSHMHSNPSGKRGPVTTWVINYLDIATTVTLGFLVGVLSLLGVTNTEVAIATVLIVLTILTTILVRLRLDLNSTAEARRASDQALLKRLEHLGRGSGVETLILLDYPDLSTEILGAEEVHVVAATSLRPYAGSYLRQLQSLARQGKKVKLVCVNPAKRSLMAVASLQKDRNSTTVASDIRSNLAIATRIRDVSPATVYVGTIDFLPTIGLVLIKNGPRQADTLYVKLLLGSDLGASPIFRVDSERDVELFEVLQRRVEASVRESTPTI